ncbi:hypothetical protein CAPI_01710 [Corynebacterium capitovis DSM 44611]|uniref:hypothetical protein n=1 Tax=Corynebacterium capitovis TaxID=131081 RepID=UPI000372346F|nr:hypothetical protein [Corynebacterium capitovis]WKD56916.1 hypothetical protein CAPI_01710 [Corynebacterium capitovis DSM 44611]
MFSALSLAFVDSINLLLIGVIVAVGIVAPARARLYPKVTGLLIAGDWLGVAGLALVMLAIFDGLGPVVHRFVEGPAFGWILIATGLATGFLALRGGDNSALVQRIMAPLRTPAPATLATGVVLGVVQSATSVPFYGGLAALSAAGITPGIRYLALLLYATIALSLPILSALLVGWVRARPGTTAGVLFARARSNPRPVTLAATWAVSVLLIMLGAVHVV